jgi:hypothetical protein
LSNPESLDFGYYYDNVMNGQEIFTGHYFTAFVGG